MTTARRYERKISGYDWDKLQELWRAIKRGRTPGWRQGKAFEYLVIRAFELDGAEVRWPYSVRIGKDELEQIDGVVYTGGLACLVECKDKATRVNIEPIAKLRNQLLRRPGAVIGSVFSREGFTEPAITLAHFTSPQTILLWTGEEVEYVLERRNISQALVTKYRICIEKGVPDYNITIEDII
ncbi:MAG: restriction endonuclease [Blastocatellia bacterium]|nr:restriction endonuclease [Blastocatellia bacterium]